MNCLRLAEITFPHRIAKLFFILIIACLGSFAPQALSQQKQIPHSNPRSLSAREIAQKVFPSVVLLVTEDSNGKPLLFGSGFFVTANSVVTNYHVIEKASQIYAKTIDKKETLWVKSIQEIDKEKDLALLYIEGANRQPLTIADSNLIAVGDIVYAVGNPEGLEGTFSEGIVSGIREIKGKQYIQITAPISEGSSGGPILNTAGEVVGIAAGGLKVGQSLNFTIPASDLLSLLGRTREEFILSKVPSNPSSNRKRTDRRNRSDTIPTSGDKVESARAYIERGKSYLGQHRFTEAVEAFIQAIRIEPGRATTHLELGAAYLLMGRYSEATEAIKQSIRLNPKEVNAHWLLGETYLLMGEYEDAIEALKQTIRLTPRDSRAHFQIGKAYILIGDRTSALEEYSILKKLNRELANKLFNEIYK